MDKNERSYGKNSMGKNEETAYMKKESCKIKRERELSCENNVYIDEVYAWEKKNMKSFYRKRSIFDGDIACGSTW